MGMFVSELWRIRGEVVARKRGGDTALAERSLQAALRIARGQEATLLQSRAAIALARHFAERGRREEARTALAESGVSALGDRAAPEIVTSAELRKFVGCRAWQRPCLGLKSRSNISHGFWESPALALHPES